jgi:hypothetical protein
MSGPRRIPRALRGWSSLLAVALLVLSSSIGCKRSDAIENRAEREANAKKVTADSTEDATEPIVDEDFGFRLGLPGPGWKLLRERDASSLNPDAVAGALNSGEGAYGIVIVERLPGTSLEQAVELLWDDSLPGLAVESEEDLQFQGVPAKRRVFTAKVEGHEFRYASTVFLRQEHLYQLMSWALVDKGRGPVTAFHEAFELIEGEVRGRSSVKEPITHADGVGWRIREGRYESALSGLQVSLPEGWRYMIGAELELLASDAEIVFLRQASSTYFALTVERVSKDRLEPLAALSRRLFEEQHGAPASEPFTREIAGQEVELRRYRQAPFEYVHGVYVGDEAITQLSVWYPQGLAEGVGESLDEVFAGFAALPAKQRQALRQELLAAPPRQRNFAATRAYRAGEFLDYENRLRWTKPPGFWRLDGFDKALQHSQETVLFAQEIELGVYAALEAFDAGTSDPAATLAALIEGDELLSRDTVEVDGLTVHRAQVIDRRQSPPMSYDMAVTRRGERMISMIAWAADDSPERRKAMAAAIAGLDYDPNLEQTELEGGVYTDVRYGFSFRLPPGMFGSPELTDLGLGRVAAWSMGKQELVSMVITGAANTDDEQWVSSFFEQVLRDRVGAEHALGTPERSAGKLGPFTARHLSWEQGFEELAADIVVRDSVVYCLLYANLPEAKIATVRDSWALLE